MFRNKLEEMLGSDSHSKFEIDNVIELFKKSKNVFLNDLELIQSRRILIFGKYDFFKILPVLSRPDSFSISLLAYFKSQSLKNEVDFYDLKVSKGNIYSKINESYKEIANRKSNQKNDYFYEKSRSLIKQVIAGKEKNLIKSPRGSFEDFREFDQYFNLHDFKPTLKSFIDFIDSKKNIAFFGFGYLAFEQLKKDIECLEVDVNNLQYFDLNHFTSILNISELENELCHLNCKLADLLLCDEQTSDFCNILGLLAVSYSMKAQAKIIVELALLDCFFRKINKRSIVYHNRAIQSSPSYILNSTAHTSGHSVVAVANRFYDSNRLSNVFTKNDFSQWNKIYLPDQYFVNDKISKANLMKMGVPEASVAVSSNKSTKKNSKLKKEAIVILQLEEESEELLKLIKKVESKFNVFYVMPHPSFPLSDVSLGIIQSFNVAVKIVHSEKDKLEAYSNSRVAITIYSSEMIRSASYGVPIISCRWLSYNFIFANDLIQSLCLTADNDPAFEQLCSKFVFDESFSNKQSAAVSLNLNKLI